MADNHDPRRVARREHPVLFGADVVFRLGLAVVPVWTLTAHPDRVWALVLIVVCGVGLLVSSALLRRAAADAGYAPSGDGPEYRRLRRYIRQSHPVLYGAEITCWLALGVAAIWRLFTHSGARWANGLWLVALAGVFVCFVLMVRRDPRTDSERDFLYGKS